MGLLIQFAIALGMIILLMTVALVRSLRRPRRKTYAVALARGEPGDPADLGLTAIERTFRLVDGADTPGWMIEGRDPAGPAVVVIHGFADSRYGALTWVELLLDFASQVVLFDLPGHGDSESPISHQGVREPDDVLAVVAQLDTLGPVVLFGYSFGASIAIAAGARDRTQRIAGVIADGPYRFWSQPISNTMRLRSYPAQPFTALAWMWLRLTQPDFRGFDRRDDAAKLRCPLLVLHGTADAVCPFDGARAIADAAPRGELVAFEGGEHIHLAQQDPARYRDHLRRFFAALGNDPASGTIKCSESAEITPQRTGDLP